MTAPLAVTIIAGYLGSGKTTLINRLLAETHDRRIMVMVNDFGDIAIDADLIAARDGDTITLTSGCVCCSMGADLFTAFTRALKRIPRPDHLVIEASGVAEPHRIADIARAEPDLTLDAIITLADCRNALAQSADPLIARTLKNQFAAASLIALSKTDLATPQQHRRLETWLAGINPQAPRLTCPLDPALILSPQDHAPAPIEAGSGDHEHDYARWSFQSPDPIPPNHLQSILDDPPAGILRLKGLSHDPDTSQTIAFHIAGAHASLSRHTFGKDHAPGTRAVAIGLKRQLDTAALDAAFSSQSILPEPAT
jgi:G3E family GTPase